MPCYHYHTSSKRLEEHFINVAPAPVLARLEGFDDCVICFMEMFCRMPVGRIVTAPDVTALHAETKMEPTASDPQTVLTAVRTGRDLANQIQVCAANSHLMLRSSSILIRRLTPSPSDCRLFTPPVTGRARSLAHRPRASLQSILRDLSEQQAERNSSVRL